MAGLRKLVRAYVCVSTDGDEQLESFQLQKLQWFIDILNENFVLDKDFIMEFGFITKQVPKNRRSLYQSQGVYFLWI